MAWIKADTKAILAIHEHVITNNARLSVTHSDYNTWTLNIRGAHREDRGIYMCQINTDPMKSQVRHILLASFMKQINGRGINRVTRYAPP